MDNDTKEQEGLQMSFLDHLDELRQRLIYSLTGIGIAFAVCFYFSQDIYRFLAVPVTHQMQKAQKLKQGKIGKIDLNKVKEGEINQYTFTEDTMLKGVKILAGNIVLVKKIIKDDKPMLVLAQPWIIGDEQISAETPVEKLIE